MSAIDLRDAKRQAESLGVRVEIKRRTGEAKFWFPDEVGGPCVTNCRKKVANRVVALRLRRMQAGSTVGESLSTPDAPEHVAPVQHTPKAAKAEEAPKMTNKSGPRNTLNFEQKVALLDYLRNNLDAISSGRKSSDEVASLATAALGFTVHGTNVRGIMGERDKCLIHYSWGGRAGSGSGKLQDRVSELESMVLELSARIDALEGN